jgi:hypothetical protein
VTANYLQSPYLPTVDRRAAAGRRAASLARSVDPRCPGIGAFADVLHPAIFIHALEIRRPGRIIPGESMIDHP